MPSLTVENYLKSALLISMRNGSQWVATGELAEALDVLPGTVTSMLKTLDESKLADYKPYEGMKLTPSGRKLALRMLRRHRLIELFLVDTLGLSWDQVHEEAEHMEHAVSDLLVDRIDEFLGRPATDPHGDPIPGADGLMRGGAKQAIRLTECDRGQAVRFVRVTNQSSDFLRYLSDAGFELGASGRVLENTAEADLVTIEIDGRRVSMGRTAAEALLVEPVADDA